MKILYFVSGLSLGGAESITVSIALEMHKKGHKVKIAHLDGENVYFKDVPGLEIINLDMRKNVQGFIRSRQAALDLICNWQPDVVHANMFHAILFARILRLSVSMHRLICTDHSIKIANSVRKILYRWTDFLSDVNTNVSKAASDYFIGKGVFSRSKSIYVYNGIDLMKFAINDSFRKEFRENQGFLDSDFIFLNVGRMVPVKNQKSLIEIVKRLNDEHVSVKLMLLGDGPLRPELEGLVKGCNLEGNVFFAGTSTMTERYYNAADCLVSSSSSEGFGLVLAEAMACGLPVISTDSGGCREVVEDDACLVPTGDAEALYLLMKKMVSTPKRDRIEIGLKNRSHAMRFELEHIINQWLELYEKSV